ncbi:MAG: hypothetical protein RLO50_21380 [Azospirillaceae bacterium]
MLSPDIEENNNNDLPLIENTLAKYGIERVPVDYFHYRQFRYTNADDAIAQAMRDAKSFGGTARS